MFEGTDLVLNSESFPQTFHQNLEFSQVPTVITENFDRVN